MQRNAPPWLPTTESPFLKGPHLWKYRTHILNTGHSVVEITQVSENGVLLQKKKEKKSEICEQVRLG